MKLTVKTSILNTVITLAALVFATSASAQDEYYDDFAPDAMAFEPDFIDAAEVKQMMEDGKTDFVLVDNAPAMAYEEEHIPGAVNFPFVAQITPPVQLPRNKTLIMYCPCGPDDADSIAMAKALRMYGYFRVKILHGGWFEWLDRGYPVYEKDAEEENS